MKKREIVVFRPRYDGSTSWLVNARLYAPDPEKIIEGGVRLAAFDGPDDDVSVLIGRISPNHYVWYPKLDLTNPHNTRSARLHRIVGFGPSDALEKPAQRAFGYNEKHTTVNYTSRILKRRKLQHAKLRMKLFFLRHGNKMSDIGTKIFCFAALAIIFFK
jgi:hypothetical protein